MRKSKCPHRYVFRERGRPIPVQAWDLDEEGHQREITADTRAVVEVCAACGKKKELEFREEVG